MFGIGLPTLRQKKVLILGSAPDPAIPDDAADRRLICVNASPWVGNRLGLPSPDITLIDRELVCHETSKAKPIRAEIHDQKLLEGLLLGTLVITQSNSTPKGDPNSLGAMYDGLIWLSRSRCKHILRTATHSHFFDDGIRGLPSTGGMAVALAAFLGSNDIAISGVRISPSATAHDYSLTHSDEPILRNHTRSDALIVASVSHWTSSISSSEESLVPLIHNWGLHPPKWAKGKPHLSALHVTAAGTNSQISFHRN